MTIIMKRGLGCTKLSYLPMKIYTFFAVSTYIGYKVLICNYYTQILKLERNFYY